MKTKTSVFNNFYVKLILTVISAFIAAYMLLPRHGEWTTLPICLVCALAVGLIKVKWLFSAGIFAVITYILTSFMVGDFYHAVISAVFAAVTALAGCFAVWLCGKRKAVYIISAAVTVIASCILHFVLFGNPVKAFPAANMLDGYVAETYTDSTVVDGMRYDPENGLFYVEAHSTNAVTVKKSICCDGKKIIDYYRDHTEISLMSDARQKLQSTLREAFPNGKFLVVSKAVSSFPNGPIDASSQLEDISFMSFDINVQTTFTADEFAALAAEYIRTLAKNDIHPASVRVRGGDMGEYFLTATAIPVDLDVPIKLYYEPDELIARYTVSKFLQNFALPDRN